MRVAFFGARGLTMESTFDAVADAHEVVLVVRAGQPIGRARRLARRVAGRERGFDAALRRRRVPSAWMSVRDDPDTVGRLRQVQPDIIVIATFPWILPAEVFAAAPRGAINLHMSLLPSHRGPTPTFGTYLADDAEAGVTVHRVTAGVDAGDILGQDRWPLPRGLDAEMLVRLQASRGSRLVVDVLARLEHGELRGAAQDESAATYAPVMPRSGRHVDFATWPAERVWHVLSGLHAWYREELVTADGRAVTYGPALGWVSPARGDAPPPGVAELRGSELVVGCRDGIVRFRPGE